MAFKAGLVVGFGVGYVLGAKAGRERYDQIMEAFHEMSSRPEVQDVIAKGRSLMDSAAAATRKT